LKCCRSCRYWDKASKKVPIDVVKVVSDKEYITISLGSRIVKIRSWKWVPKDMEKYKLARIMRVCFYGKGIITPWDECQYYEGMYGDRLYCDVSNCEYSMYCPKFRSEKTYYIT